MVVQVLEKCPQREPREPSVSQANHGFGFAKNGDEVGVRPAPKGGKQLSGAFDDDRTAVQVGPSNPAKLSNTGDREDGVHIRYRLSEPTAGKPPTHF